MANKKTGAPSLKYEDVCEEFTRRGCELLTRNYENNRQKLKYVCKCGEERETTLKSFKQSGRCRQCLYDIRRLDFDYVKKVFEDAGCELLEKDYLNNQTPLEYRCSCGEVSETILANFQRGSRCRGCGIERWSSKQRHSYEFVRNFFEEQGCELLEKTYSNANQRLEYICVCGNVSRIAFHSFRRGQRCRDCGLKKQGEATRGERHPNWNPELTDEDRQDKRLYREYKEWRKKVYERDKYACVKCGDDSGGNLNAHHINSYAIYRELRTEVSNGVTLCEVCHKRYHKEFGINNANKEDFRKFMEEEVDPV